MASTMLLLSNFLAFIATITITISCSFCTTIEANNMTGFTVELIHRDSPNSPLYDSSITSQQRLKDALRRSFSRVYHFKRGVSTGFPDAETISSSGEYLMNLAIGTPLRPTFAIIDSGSDLIWVQCDPCKHCFNQTPPIFKPKTSSTYKPLSCDSPSCSAFYGSFCGKGCEYTESFGDGSYTTGDLAEETLTLSSAKSANKVSFPRVIFGCGHDDDGTFSSATAGVVGFGAGKVSLVSQLTSQIRGKFSYCLVPVNSSAHGKLNFAAKALVSGLGVVSTPIISTANSFYTLTLEGISVGNKRFGILEKDSSTNMSRISAGIDIIIDSGTTLTMLPTELYTSLEKQLARQIKLQRTKDPTGFLNLCYKTKNVEKIPQVIVHFKGADVKLKTENVLFKIEDDVFCLAFIGTDDLPIYGNVAQINFSVGYDLVKKTVSFKATDCTEE